MATSSYAASGLLVLDRLTPTIRALFGEHHLVDKLEYGKVVEFSLGTELGEPLWRNLLPHLKHLATERGVSPPPENEQTSLRLLQEVAASFHLTKDKETRDILASTRFDGIADVSMLFRLCLKFDDDHGLRNLLYQGSRWSDGREPFAYGGNACFLSRHAQLFVDTTSLVETGELISRGVEIRDMDLAAEHIATAAWELIHGISDASLRGPVAARVAYLLPKLALLDHPIRSKRT